MLGQLVFDELGLIFTFGLKNGSVRGDCPPGHGFRATYSPVSIDSKRTLLTYLRYLDSPSMLPILFAAPSREYYLSGRGRNRMPVEWHLTVL